ncbi:MAG: hypothetical protein D6814_00600, partial [Calditrichaeota bacterium]
LVVASINSFSWLFLRRMESSLDRELGRRLQSVSGLIAKLVESELFGTRLDTEMSTVDRYLLSSTLDELRLDHQLQAIYLVDHNLTTILSSPAHFRPGEVIGYLKDDSLQIRQAFRGQVAASPLHVIQGNQFKSGYAPFRNELGEVVGLVVIEASPTFFSLLAFFQRGLILLGVVSGMVILIFTLFIIWAVTLFIRLQETVHRNERLAAMGQMAAIVAHEIRNPLGIIKSTAEVLRNRYKDPGKSNELFDFIPDEVERLNRLVNDFLTFARDRDLETLQEDLVSTVRKAIEDIRAECKSPSITIQFHPAVEHLVVPHNPDGIRQVILNLVHNAIEAMEAIEGEIKVLLIPETNWGKKVVKVSVIDNGPGLKQDADKIFEPFFTTKTSGSGLGLAVTKQIIEKHGGRIEAESPDGGGTEIRFYLPI